MKKILLLCFIVGFICTGLTGCANNDDEDLVNKCTVTVTAECYKTLSAGTRDLAVTAVVTGISANDIQAFDFVFSEEGQQERTTTSITEGNRLTASSSLPDCYLNDKVSYTIQVALKNGTTKYEYGSVTIK